MVIDATDDAFGVVFPDAPGCTAMGKSWEEAIENAKEALSEWAADQIAAGRQPSDAIRHALKRDGF